LKQKKFEYSDIVSPKNKNAEEIVIVGSGESLNDLSQEEIIKYGEMDSIGINFSGFHKSLKCKECLIELKPDSYSLFAKLIINNPGQKMYINHFMAKNLKDQDILIDLYSKKNIFSFDVVRFRSSSISTFRRLMSFHLRIGHFFVRKPIHNGASLVMALTIAAIRKYKRIHIVGVDLNGSNYFYENGDYLGHPWEELCSRRTPEVISFEKNNKKHATQSSKFAQQWQEFSIDETVPFIIDYLKNCDVQIVVPNPASGFNAYLK